MMHRAKLSKFHTAFVCMFVTTNYKITEKRGVALCRSKADKPGSVGGCPWLGDGQNVEDKPKLAIPSGLFRQVLHEQSGSGIFPDFEFLNSESFHVKVHVKATSGHKPYIETLSQSITPKNNYIHEFDLMWHESDVA